MEGIQFDEPNYNYRYTQPQRKRGLTDWLLKTNIAKDEQQAHNILIGVAIIALVIAFFGFIKLNKKVNIPSNINPETGEILPGETNKL